MRRGPIPRWLVAAVCIGAIVTIGPFAPWIVLGIWLALYAQRIHEPMMRVFAGRRGVAATVTVLLLLVVIVPIAAMVATLVIEAFALVQELLRSDEAKTVLERLARGNGADTHERISSSAAIAELLRDQGGRAWGILRQVAGATAHVVIGLLILITGMYGVLVDGRAWYSWFERHAPVPASTVKRLADAFVETGRGLAFGIVGAGLIQSTVATIAYLILGVPQALPLGMLTLLLSVVPAVGTALVWVPVAAGLAMTGRTGAALALVVVGVAVIGSVDNLARPYLARRGQLQLPTYVVLISMFGGIEVIGAWGLILGPLAVRLAKEALLIWSEADSVGVSDSGSAGDVEAR